MEPTTVSSADDALTALRDAAADGARLDVVISDCQMPDVDGFTLARRIKQDRRLRSTPVVMLTSMGSAGDIAQCRKIGVDKYLTKPVKHSDLLDALVTLFGGAARLGRGNFDQAAVEQPRRQLRVLVAEDNAVNRKLVARLLEKRGHKVHPVEDGRAAVEAIVSGRHGRFDAVLMDLQMPEMSGLEATEAIRVHEKSAGSHVPIIALTAHAMAGDRERCLAAGMDAYLSKPIDVNQMILTVEGFDDAADRATSTAADATAPGPVFDHDAALAYAGGDRQLLEEVIALFRADYPTAVRRMERAIRAGDGEALRAAAHALKGAIATVGSKTGRDAAARLEQLGRACAFDAATGACATLRDEIKRLEDAFATAGLTPAGRRRPGRAPATSSRAASRKRSKSHESNPRRRR